MEIRSEGSDYSESFELDDSNSEISSESNHEAEGVLSELNQAPLTIKQPANKLTKKPPIIKKELPSGDTELRRTIRSPITFIEQENHLKSSQEKPAPTATSPALTFKDAAGKVQKLQSSAKKFTNSDEIREVVFKDWLAKKEVKDMRTRKLLDDSKRIDIEKKRERELELLKRSEDKVKKWKESKECLLQAKQKAFAEEAERKAAEAEEKLLKSLEIKKSAEKWRQEKTKMHVQKHKRKRKNEEAEEKKKLEEKEEKKKENNQAYTSWYQHKERVIKETLRKKRKQKKALELAQREEIIKRQMESKKSVHVWKSKKAKLKSSPGKTKQALHSQAWCPARSFQTFPKATKHSLEKHKTRSIDDVDQKEENSYSFSFDESDGGKYEEESDGGDSECNYEEEEEESYSFSESSTSSSSFAIESVSRTVSPSKGIRKTIQVCCQTLHYWCNCDQ